MNVRKKTLLSAALVAVLVFSITVLLVFRESKKISQETILKIISDKADLEVKNVIYREVGDDDLKWEIRAERASYMKKENKALFDKVELKIHLSQGKTYVMTGDKGRLDTDTKDMEISGNVEIVSDSGERFETDCLQYSYKEKRLHTEAKVVMKTPKMQISGVGMSLSLANKDMVLLSKVHARINKFGVNKR
jgi:LPS export ABC transporter protein LptC